MHGLYDFRMSRLTRTTKSHMQLAADTSRALGKYQNAIRKLGSLLDIMCYEHNRPGQFVEHAR